MDVTQTPLDVVEVLVARMSTEGMEVADASVLLTRLE